MQKTWVWSLGWEDPREEGKATHSSILAWRTSMDRRAWQTEESMGPWRVKHGWSDLAHTGNHLFMEDIPNPYPRWMIPYCHCVHLQIFLGFPCGSVGKESACNVGDLGSIPGLGERLLTPVFWPGEFHGLYCPWGSKSWTWLSNFHFHFTFASKHVLPPPSPGVGPSV